MKIAMIIDAWEPIVGGGQIHVRNICEKLIKNKNCEIDLFVRSLKGDDEKIYNQDEILLDGKLRIIRCGRVKHFFDFSERILSIYSIFFRVLKENKKQKYDLIHAHTFLGLLSGKLSSIFLNIPIIATIHGANLMDVGNKTFYYFIEKFLLTKLKYNTIISVGSSFLKYPNVNKNIVVIGNGVNIEEFENLKEEKKEDIYKILFVGRLEWTKGIDLLIESIKKIDKNILEEKKVEFHLVGYGYQEDEYKKLVQKCHLEKYIIFKGKIVGDDLIREYKTSDLFILPSRTEGFGMTIIEAMASKLAVISTKCGGPEDIIENGKNGFLIEKENIEDLKNILIDFITGKISNLDIIKENRYNTVVNNYTWDIIGDKIYNEYKKITK
ncbi:MAG: glycosyltransferase family 4 protein [Candidatus Gracilibacteria bacterium]|nr:glycosyltransferase family 4 protein [Candidatus Gracilibacteria bacterium]